MTVKVTGTGKTISELNHILQGKQRQIYAGLMEAGLKVRRQAQKIVPVDQGILRGSAFSRRNMDGSLGVEIGFSAEYALWVHENRQVNAGKKRSSGRGVYWGPSGEPGFLDTALNMIKPEIPEIIARRMAGG